MSDNAYIVEGKSRFRDLLQPADKTVRLFVTLSGAHLFGFPSVDSDFDFRGVFAMSREQLFGIDPPNTTVEFLGDGERPNDLVLQEAQKFALLLRKGSGSVLEQVLSPLVIETSDFHRELFEIAPNCVTVRSLLHYRGFFNNQLSLMRRRPDKEVKILLYAFRVLMTALYLARSGRVEANIVVLNETFRLDFIDELIGIKISAEHGTLPLSAHGREFYESRYEALYDELETELSDTTLPETLSRETEDRLKDWLFRVREATICEP